MWGQARHFQHRNFPIRIIPTRVGTSRRISPLLLILKDHPHACGDKVFTSPLCVSFKGSSPRVWGQVKKGKLNFGEVRIIPTRVGTSIIFGLYFVKKEDHPHACGDKFAIYNGLITIIGSSPRVWGQVDAVYSERKNAGIIPTRVGTRCICVIMKHF